MSSAKWRAMQHRHKYTYSSVIFPSTFIDVLKSSPLSTDSKSASFFTELSQLSLLTSAYAQVAHSKSLSSSFAALVALLELNDQQDRRLFESASKLYLEVLFVPNSLPLHRALLSGLFKVGSKDGQQVICFCFRELFEAYTESVFEADNGRKRFSLSRVALSVMGMPKLHYLVSVVDECADSIAWDVVLGLEGVVLETEECSRPSPIVLEQCQEGLSCLYYLIQRFPNKFKGPGLLVTKRVVNVLVRVLHSMSFSRDCFVSAGVSFFATLQVFFIPEELGLFIFQIIFNECNIRRSISCSTDFKDFTLKIPFEGDLCAKICGISSLSRLCLIRGILTAVPRELLNSHFFIYSDCATENKGNGISNSCFVKTILFDAILPELCHYCENPVDSHFNFHALTVMQICLQQIKTSLEGKLTDLSENYVPILDNMGSRILKIIWNNLEDPLSQTVKQVHLIFDLFLDIRSTSCWEHRNDSMDFFLRRIAMDLLHMGSRCKGRYVPLALLTKRLGAKSLLNMNPRLLFETIQAYNDDDVCCAATTFLKCFLENLRDQCWDSDGVEKGYASFRNECLSSFLHGLASGVSKLRSNINTYALPILLEVDIDSIFPLLSSISVELSGVDNGFYQCELSNLNVVPEVEPKVAVLVSLLKVCRSLALLEGDIDADRSLMSDTGSDSALTGVFAFVRIKGIKVKVPVEWLVIALTHIDEFLRVDAAESLFLTPKTSSIPSQLELNLLKKAIPLNMRSSSTGFQMKWTSLFRKLLSRVRTALDRQLKLETLQPRPAEAKLEPTIGDSNDETCTERAHNLYIFMKWLSSFLFFSCYPSAPYKRKVMAMELILIMLNVWPIVSFSDSDLPLFTPYNHGISSPNFTLLLVGSVIDSWDRLRESSLRILLCFPTPLPGISCQEKVYDLILWANKLVCSPRVRESDAGALILRLVFRRYVIDLGWPIKVFGDTPSFRLLPHLVNGVYSGGSIVEYISSLVCWLNAVVEDGERDLLEACKNCFVHGVLLSLRYTFDELDWNSKAVISSIVEIKLLLEKLLNLIMRITSIALWVVSADAWYLPNEDDIIDDEVLMMDGLDLVSMPHADDSSLDLLDKRPQEQIIMVGCWLAMKEVSLLLGTIIRKIPLPTASSADWSQMATTSSNTADSTTPIEVLNIGQLKQIGSHFLEILLKMKHNGAIDKTRAGFTALCNRLLCSNDARLCRLTESWMEQLMERTIAKGQVVDDLLRRSAGIPAAFMALFLSEPEGAPKKLLPRALRWLIDVASSSVLINDTSSNTSKSSLSIPEEGILSSESSEKTLVDGSSKTRKEGVIPTVHAFNVLRACFNDTNLPSDTSGFAAEALILSIRAFSSSHWEVRNGACLAYTALIRRMIGFMNVQKRESARRALTGLEFFHRYPSLHPFIFEELRFATDLLNDGVSNDLESNLAKAVHPSLCPLLILLSRLKPSTLASESGDNLDPFLFLPFIRQCSMQSNMRIRVLASKALTCLVSNEKLPLVLLNIASELLNLEHCIPSMSFNWMHGMLLQLISLVDANCRNLVDSSKRDKVIGDLTEVVAKISWIASPRTCPCPILNAAYLKLLYHMLSVSRAGQKGKTFHEIRNLLLNLSADCLDMPSSFGLLYYDPCIIEVRKQAAMSYLSCVLHLTKEGSEELPEPAHTNLANMTSLSIIDETVQSFPGLCERLVRLVSDPAYEVRLATLKWLLRFINSTELLPGCSACYEIGIIIEWMNSKLHSKMMELLDNEKNHRCVNYILKILFCWNTMLSLRSKGMQFSGTSYLGNFDLESLDKCWHKLISMYNHTRRAKTKEALICCMAMCANHYSSLLTCYVSANSVERASDVSELQTATRSFERLSFFVSLIKLHSLPSESVNMRLAVVESVIASGLLEQSEPISQVISNKLLPVSSSSVSFSSQDAGNIYGSLLLDVWFTCIKLLEDEDDVVRQKLAVNIQKCFSREGSPGNSFAERSPSQVENVIKLCFDHLSSVFGYWIHYFDCLLQWVYDAANYVSSSRDLVRQVFDKEIDNHHEEKLFICQICCIQLKILPISKCWMNHSSKELDFKHLYQWRSKFWNQAVYFMKDHEQKQGEFDWIAGMGNHKDAFLPLYANLLGFYTLSSIIFIGEVAEGATLLDEVVELGKFISPFLTNSLISSLYTTIVKAHETKLGAFTDRPVSLNLSADGPVWENFEPYFLIR